MTANATVTPAAIDSTTDIWWARGGPEERIAVEYCAKPGCHGRPTSPFDLYCDGPEPHMTVVDPRSRAQVMAVYALRGLFGILAVVAAALGSAVPLYAAAGLAGLLLLVLPLRAFRTSRSVSAVGWVVVLAYLAVRREALLSDAWRDHVVTISLAIVLAALPVAVFVRVRRARDGEPSRDAVAVGVTGAVALGLFVVLETLGVTSAGSDIARWAKIGALAAASGAIGAATVTGLVDGVRRVEYKPGDGRLPRFDPPDLTVPGDPTSSVPVVAAKATFGERLLRGMQLAAIRLTRLMTKIANAAVALAWGAAEFVARAATRSWHAVRSWAVHACRVIAAAIGASAEAMVAGMATAATTGRQWTISAVLPLALVVLAGAAAVTASWAFSKYLDGGSLDRGLVTVVLALGAAGALATTWWALTRWPPGIVAAAAQRTTENAAPTLFVTLVALGWLTGIAGLMGVGPLRPGWLTFAGTLILVGSLGYTLAKQRAQAATS